MEKEVKTIRTSEINFSKVEKIYHGLDNHCRCGCGGQYFDKTTEKWPNKVAAIKRLGEVEADITDTYINISLKNNKAYTLYFE